ncbi:MAG: VWA domain-containing protein [Dehalococcoidia bacterium]
MEFAYPYLLGLAALAIPVLAAAWWRRRAAVAIPAAAGVAGLAPNLRLRAARLLPLCRVAAVVLLAIALARPRTGEVDAVVPAEGIDIALSLDISSSMTALMPGDEDQRDRLEVTKSVIRAFIEERENDRIGFVVFQKDSLALTPPTLDYDALDRIVADIETGLLPDGTGIGVGMASALNMLRDSNAASRIVILLTDGDHNATSISPEDAADVASALRIRVYTIGVVDREGIRASGDVNEERLRSIAERTGGKYYAADSPDSLAEVYEEIGRLETSRVGGETFERYEEYAPWFAAAAAAVLGVELLLAATWLRRSPA